MSQLLTDVCREDKEQRRGGEEAEGDDAWCYISGPNGFIDAAERACRQVRGLTSFAARWD